MTLAYGVQIKVSQIAGKLDIGFAISADWNRRKQMNKQEAIEKIKNIDTLNINDMAAGQQVDMVIKNQVIAVISQIDEPQKPVVPKFVAEWIEEARAEEYSLYGALEMVGEANEDWIFGNDKTNQETFARAWIDGYEVEKEKLYTVEIPNPNSAGGKLVLFKQQSTGRLILDILNPNINKPKYLQLTEAEIKQDFEWAWQWAVPVEVEDIQ
jgi:hypothetical protein